MAVFRGLLALAFVCLGSLGLAQRSDQVAAARVLGPRWEQLSRSAGMIFSGTVLSVEMQSAGKGRLVALILIKFRVDRAIAGVQPGQLLAVHEWAGAWSTHRAMGVGQPWLIFLYPPSRLGLTSPVGGPLGQVVLGSSGEMIQTSAAEAGVDSAAVTARLKPRPFKAQSRSDSFQQIVKHCSTQSPTLRTDRAAATPPIATLRQLERAIRDARENASAAFAGKKE